LRLPERVQDHYGALDRFYREIWGEHVHHGLWAGGDETPAEAVEALVARVAEAAELGRRSQPEVCDVGAGYGATSRLLARRFGARCTAITLSPAQHAWGARRSEGAASDPVAGPKPRHLLGDWLRNGLPDASFDAVIAIESLTHMADLGRALAEAYRVLRPGGRMVACVWLSDEAASRTARRWLLDPIVSEGRLAGLPSADEVGDALEGVGFSDVEHVDLSRSVRRTWSICIGRALRRVVSDREARSFLLDPAQPDRVFALTMVRIWLAYRTGAMRYGLFSAARGGA